MKTMNRFSATAIYILGSLTLLAIAVASSAQSPDPTLLRKRLAEKKTMLEELTAAHHKLKRVDSPKGRVMSPISKTSGDLLKDISTLDAEIRELESELRKAVDDRSARL